MQEINEMKVHIKDLKETLENFKTYSANVFMINALNKVIENQENCINSIEKNFNEYVELTETKI